MEKIVSVYLVECLTNMHVGMGGVNYDMIDNLVQRDVTSKMPTINSSSLKGALREFFENIWGENDEKINHIFGVDLSSKKEQEGSVGNYKFFSADLLSLPVRAAKRPFYNATCPFLMEHINYLSNQLRHENLISTNYQEEGVKKGYPKIEGEKDQLEDWEATEGLKFNDEIIGNRIALFSDEDFKRLAEKLPVIARNKLDNGVSKNLFYEEIVPRETRFVFFVLKSDKYSEDFDKALEDNVVQIGANGSIGYGFCKIKKIK